MNLHESHHQSTCFNVCNTHERESKSPELPYSSQQIDQDGFATAYQRTTKKEMDELLAQALSGLTFEERQQNEEILHGVDEKISEEASFICEKLEEVDFHLMSVKVGTKYEVAELLDPCYVNNKAFRVMFLRANEYDAKAAADQMIRFFESKNELFGEDKLTKDITMEDLDEDDIASLELGWMQNIGRDRSGRHVFSIFAGLWVYSGPQALLTHMRAQYFFIMKMLQSEETQLRGTVTLWYNLGNFKNAKTTGCKELYTSVKALPFKEAAIHNCIDSMAQYVLFSLVLKVMKGVVRARFRLHFGSHIECQYQLTTFGIPSSLIPIDGKGRLDLTRHIQWLQACAAEDNVSYVASSASCGALLQTSSFMPKQNDVLFSNGRSGSNYHPGNKRFRTLVENYIQAYSDTNSDLAKRELVATVIAEVHASGGRFFKRNGDDSTTGWEEVPMEELRTKIMQSFRNKRRLLSASKQDVIGPRGVLIAGDPRPNDVIFGRTVQRNPGSELLNRLINENFAEYQSLDRGTKIKLVESIMQQIKDLNGRFVQSDPETGRWIEVFDDNARERISKSFRNLRRKHSSTTK